MVKCNECGFESEEDFEYCPDCGEKINKKKVRPIPKGQRISKKDMKEIPKIISQFFLGVLVSLMFLVSGTLLGFFYIIYSDFREFVEAEMAQEEFAEVGMLSTSSLAVVQAVSIGLIFIGIVVFIYFVVKYRLEVKNL